MQDFWPSLYLHDLLHELHCCCDDVQTSHLQIFHTEQSTVKGNTPSPEVAHGARRLLLFYASAGCAPKNASLWRSSFQKMTALSILGQTKSSLSLQAPKRQRNNATKVKDLRASLQFTRSGNQVGHKIEIFYCLHSCFNQGEMKGALYGTRNAKGECLSALVQ